MGFRQTIPRSGHTRGVPGHSLGGLGTQLKCPDFAFSYVGENGNAALPTDSNYVLFLIPF